jgi:endoglucanase
MTTLISRRALLMSAAATLLPSVASAVVPHDRFMRLARGFNLPDQAPLAPSKTPDPATLKWLRRRGMTHVRLPVVCEALAPGFSDAERIKTTLADVDRALDLLLSLDFVVTIDMHPGGAFAQLHRTDHESALAALAQAWRALAERVAPRPTDRVFVELLNEPNTTDDIWRDQAERLAATLRVILPETTFIVGPAPYQRIEALAAWRPLDDSNVVYAFHYYDPMFFTHQGLTWDASSPFARLSGVPYPTHRGDPRIQRLTDDLRKRGDGEFADEIDRALDQPWAKETIEHQFSALADWGRAHGVPIILNEFGVLRFKAARASRLAWLRDVRETAEANGFGWTHWDYREGFGLLDESGKPDGELIEALVPSQKRAAMDRNMR